MDHRAPAPQHEDVVGHRQPVVHRPVGRQRGRLPQWRVAFGPVSCGRRTVEQRQRLRGLPRRSKLRLEGADLSVKLRLPKNESPSSLIAPPSGTQGTPHRLHRRTELAAGKWLWRRLLAPASASTAARSSRRSWSTISSESHACARSSALPHARCNATNGNGQHATPANGNGRRSW